MVKLFQECSYWLDDHGSIPGRVRFSFLFATASRLVMWLMKPPVKWVPEVFPRGKEAGLCSYLPIFISAEIKKTWSYTSTLPYVFMSYV
jgi:hypothetical protein